MDWHTDPAWAEIFDDSGPWVHHVATAWRAAATAAPVTVPPPPAVDRDGHSDHAETIAFWSAPFHLLAFGLGWTRVDRGLERWQKSGFQLTDPVLGTVRRWLGVDNLQALVAHAAAAPALARIGLAAHGLNRSLPEGGTLPDTTAYRRVREISGAGFDGNLGDSLHIFDHICPGGGEAPAARPVAVTAARPTSAADPTVPRVSLLFDRYAGWYAALSQVAGQKANNGRRVRADVVVRPVGWLGEYRRHDDTGLWFRGQASVHLWGQ